MSARVRRPTSGPAWVSWVTATLTALENRGSVQPPIAAMMLWAGNDLPPLWLPADGATIDADEWPVLADQLGGTTLPNPAHVGALGWIIRAG